MRGSSPPAATDGDDLLGVFAETLHRAGPTLSGLDIQYAFWIKTIRGHRLGHVKGGY